jgi:hypothetical protein
MNMKKTKIALSILAFVLTASMSAFGQTPEGSWNLEWSDEFNGSSLNTNSWNIQTGNLGVNNELQTYAADRVTVGGGALTIFGSWDWDNNRLESGRINSQNKITWDEGYTEARIRFEDWDWNGKDATFAAFWSMGESYGKQNVSAHNVNGGSAWPSCGENDIMEMVPNHSAISTIHYNPSLDYNGDGNSDVQNWPNNWVYHTVSAATPDWSQWHTFGCEKTATELKYYIDGVYTGSHTLDETRKEFHQPFFYILNVAIGGDLAGNPPNNYDVFIKMHTDYVRYYKRAASQDWTITLKGSNGRFVTSADGQAAMTCNTINAQAWEKFDVVDAGNGKVALRGNNGRFVSSENGTAPMRCNRPEIGAWETFTWVDLGNYKFALQGSNGRFICSENGTTGMMCNRETVSEWETFTWTTSTKSATIANLTVEEKQPGIYPNPVSNILNIVGVGENETSTIYSISGAKIMEATGTAIDVSDFKNGMYLIKVNGKFEKFMKK